MQRMRYHIHFVLVPSKHPRSINYTYATSEMLRELIKHLSIPENVENARKYFESHNH